MKLKNGVFRLYPERKLADEIVSALVIIIAISGLLYFFSVREIFIIRPTLQSEGTLTTATYIDRYSSSGESGQHYTLVYEYRVESSTYQRRYTTDFGRVEIGDSVQIRYMIDDPDISRTLFELEELIPISPYVWLMGGIIVIIKLISSLWQLTSLHRHGQLIYGELSYISGVWEEDKDRKVQYIVKISYNFIEPQTGAALYGDAQTVRSDLSQGSLPALGTPVAIYYLNEGNFRLL